MIFTYKDLGNAGRMSNQLFEIACTISTAIDHNAKFIFPLWKYEQYFSLHGCFSDDTHSNIDYTEPSFKYTPINFQKSNDIINLKGYFQSEKYFKNNEALIRNFFSPTAPLPQLHETTSIHVRRGDYLQFQDCHPITPMSYYQSAMEEIKSDKYLIFSDDIEWCKQNFIGKHFEFSEGKNEIEDLFLMKSCENNIICNSSFSWWAAWLNNNPAKKIIAPKTWFGPKLSMHDISDLIPQEWKTV